MTTDRYDALCTKYLRDGEELLDRQDYTQASEKFWGAAAEALKFVAATRGLRHYSHGDMRGVVRSLRLESAEPMLPDLFRAAEALHANFYEDFMTGEAVRAGAASVRTFVARLRALSMGSDTA